MAVTRDISILPEHLYAYAIELMTAFGYFVFDENSRILSVASDADGKIIESLRANKFTMPMRLSFNVGIECLLKAVLLKCEIPIISHSRATKTKAKLLTTARNYSSAEEICDFIADWGVYADSWTWARKQLAAKNIFHMFDISTGTLGALIPQLRHLVAKGIVTEDEYKDMTNSLLVFAAIRRNVDAHTFFGIKIAGGIQHDLSRLYVPTVNTLIQAYWRARE